MSTTMVDEDRTESLVVRAQQGDRTAFTGLMERHRDSLVAAVTSRLGSHLRKRIDAHDVLQETALRAFARIEHFQWLGPESFSRWLHRIAVNVIRELAKRERRIVLIPRSGDVPHDGVTQGTAMRRNERFDRLRRALDTLSSDYRQVIVLARLERLHMKEVARRMERSPEAATQLLWRAMQQLKTTFGTTDSLHLPHRRLNDSGAHRET